MADAHGRMGWFDLMRVGTMYPPLLSRLAIVPPADRANTRVLDLPAGRGVLSLPLAAAGFDVTPCDLFPEGFEESRLRLRGRPVEEGFREGWKGRWPASLKRRLFGDRVPPAPDHIRCVAGDLEARLPFGDAEFDWVLFVEGIEHIPDRHRALMEVRRVLKRQGTLLLTTPNLLSVRARLAFAFVGQRTFKTWFDEHTGVQGRDEEGTRIYHGHAFLADYFQLRYSLHQTGFRIRRLVPTRRSLTSVLLLPFLFPPIWLFTRLATRLGRRRFTALQRGGRLPADAKPPHAEMVRHILSTPMLLDRVIAIEAEAV
ncbi:MAG: class I SAM-dependent methyltransferase [Planctomycetaceae bacterium]